MGVDGDVKVCAARVVVSVSPAAAVVRVSDCSVSSRRHLDIGHEVWRGINIQPCTLIIGESHTKVGNHHIQQNKFSKSYFLFFSCQQPQSFRLEAPGMFGWLVP